MSERIEQAFQGFEMSQEPKLRFFGVLDDGREFSSGNPDLHEVGNLERSLRQLVNEGMPSSEDIEAASLLARINLDLTVEEGLVAELMKRQGL